MVVTPLIGLFLGTMAYKARFPSHRSYMDLLQSYSFMVRETNKGSSDIFVRTQRGQKF